MVRVGALQQANGGYLILDIHRILGRPFVWEALKQALFARQVRIESPADALGFVSTTTLKPEPIPLDVKVVLIGERWLYYVLSNYDKEFSSLFKVAADFEFKVAADFDDVLARSDDNVQAFAWLVSAWLARTTMCRRLHGLSVTESGFVSCCHSAQMLWRG
jgi:predicted ATP-dependent protease